MKRPQFWTVLLVLGVAVRAVASAPACDCKDLPDIKNVDNSCLLGHLMQIITHLINAQPKPITCAELHKLCPSPSKREVTTGSPTSTEEEPEILPEVPKEDEDEDNGNEKAHALTRDGNKSDLEENVEEPSSEKPPEEEEATTPEAANKFPSLLPIIPIVPILFPKPTPETIETRTVEEETSTVAPEDPTTEANEEAPTEENEEPTTRESEETTMEPIEDPTTEVPEDEKVTIQASEEALTQKGEEPTTEVLDERNVAPTTEETNEATPSDTSLNLPIPVILPVPILIPLPSNQEKVSEETTVVKDSQETTTFASDTLGKTESQTENDIEAPTTTEENNETEVTTTTEEEKNETEPQTTTKEEENVTDVSSTTQQEELTSNDPSAATEEETEIATEESTTATDTNFKLFPFPPFFVPVPLPLPSINLLEKEEATETAKDPVVGADSTTVREEPNETTTFDPTTVPEEKFEKTTTEEEVTKATTEEKFEPITPEQVDEEESSKILLPLPVPIPVVVPIPLPPVPVPETTTEVVSETPKEKDVSIETTTECSSELELSTQDPTSDEEEPTSCEEEPETLFIPVLKFNSATCMTAEDLKDFLFKAFSCPRKKKHNHSRKNHQ